MQPQTEREPFHRYFPEDLACFGKLHLKANWGPHFQQDYSHPNPATLVDEPPKLQLFTVYCGRGGAFFLVSLVSSTLSCSADMNMLV